MFNVRCPKCSTLLKAPDEAAGKKVKCVKCGREFMLARPPLKLRANHAAGSRKTALIAAIASIAIGSPLAIGLTGLLVWNFRTQSPTAVAGQAGAETQSRPINAAGAQPAAQKPVDATPSNATAASAPRANAVPAIESLAQRRSRLIREHDAAVEQYNALPNAPSDLELDHEQDRMRLEAELEEGKIRSEVSQKTSDLVLKNNLSSDEYESRRRQIEQDGETEIFNRKRERRKKYQDKLAQIVATQRKKADLALKIAMLREELAAVEKELGGPKK